MYEDQREKIQDFYQRYRRMPSYAEMMKLTGYRSKNAVHKLVAKLVDLGIVAQDEQGRLIPTRGMDEVPLLGLVEAGIPTSVDAEVGETLDINAYLVEDRTRSYVLEVKGDSMIDEGIKEGDLVVAKKGGEPREGDIVIAEVDGGWTMKYLRKKNGKSYLEPANKNYKPIYPKYDLKIAAIVKGVIRKY